MDTEFKQGVAVCENQPVTAEGLRALLKLTPDLEFAGEANSLPEAVELVRHLRPRVLVLDKGFGTRAVLECLAELKGSGSETAPVIWGIAVTEAEALRFIQAGAKGVIRKSANLDDLLACLRGVASGDTWMEENAFGARPRTENEPRPGLTPRELQVVELAGQGLKNREIGSELGIRPGTVKVHLKHIFEKTGIRGRFGLALAELHTKR